MSLLIISSLIFSLLGGVLYIVRGGGFGDQYSDIHGWLAAHNLPAPRNLYIVGAILLPLITCPYLAINGLHGLTHAAMITAIIIGYILTLVSGWGAYYSMGNNPHYYVDHSEVAWIDWVLYKLYGPMWIPAGVTNADPVSYDLIPSPTGGPNDPEWLHKRALTGMILRFTHSIALFGLIAAVRYFMMHDASGALIAVAMVIPSMAVGFIYDYFVTAETLATESSNPWRFEQPIGKSEVATGVWLSILIAIAVFA